jgi:hypothetical protein
MKFWRHKLYGDNPMLHIFWWEDEQVVSTIIDVKHKQTVHLIC